MFENGGDRVCYFFRGFKVQWEFPDKVSVKNIQNTHGNYKEASEEEINNLLTIFTK